MTVDTEAPELQLTNPDSNLDDLAHIYLVYQDPCNGINGVEDFRKETYKAFKGTVRLCLQTLRTTHNSSTETVATASHTNLTWVGTSKEPVSVNSPIDGNWTTHLNDEEFVIDYATTLLIGGQLATSLNFSASYVTGGDNYLYGSIFATSLTSEVIGPDPLVCPNSTEYGLKAFDKRLANVAIGLTNA